jgi:hypothetical protein
VSDKGAKVSVNTYKNQAKAAGTSKFAQLAHSEHPKPAPSGCGVIVVFARHHFPFKIS